MSWRKKSSRQRLCYKRQGGSGLSWGSLEREVGGMRGLVKNQRKDRESGPG